jgi:hypothetical protein
MLDSIQIFNLNYLYSMMVRYKWRTNHPRIDSLISEITNRCNDDNVFNQTIYVPLREMVRHFDGYDVFTDNTVCPALELPSNTFYYKDTIKNIEIGDTLYMTSESNKYDSSAIVVKRKEDICGYVPRDLKEKIKLFVPSTVIVFDKRYIENGIYSLRVDIILPPHSNTDGSL